VNRHQGGLEYKLNEIINPGCGEIRTEREIDMNNTLKTRDSQLRRKADRLGYRLIKSRAKIWNYNNQLGYMITDKWRNYVVAGSQMDMSLDDVSSWLDGRG
jgi:hypothetical protein